jgi:hypothetical protein
LFLFLMPSCRRFGTKNAYPECLSKFEKFYPNMIGKKNYFQIDR